jgi:hypothetical protein
MQHRNATLATFIGTLAAVTLSAGACNREPAPSRDAAAVPEAAREVDRTAELRRERDDDISRLDRRVADVERKYTEANQKVVSGSKNPTQGLREELKEDVTNVKEAVGDLRTTTPENWWDRHEAAMQRTANDIENDVRRLAGMVSPTPPSDTTGTTGETVSTVPFTSRRDKFVAELRSRTDAMEKALENVKARGATETEVEDTRARVKKLADDLDRLRSASAEDWWSVTKARVTEYVDRVEGSVDRLDNDKS